MSTRYAFLAFIYIIKKCVGIFVIVFLSFVFHYYAMQAALAATASAAGSQYERGKYFADNPTGLFSIYVALSTANHPDVWMHMYNEHWYLMLILLSFMIVTNIFLLNVLLAVVSNAYSSMIRRTVEQRSHSNL